MKHVSQKQYDLYHADCLDILRSLPDNSVDSCVCDPPAGISFMGHEWDHNKGGRDAWIVWLKEIMAEAMRVLKPGGHAFVWALPRTSHWTATACEDAGFELRDVCLHLYSTGFPKSLSVSKAIDKLAGAERSEGKRTWRGDRRASGIVGKNLGTQTRAIYDTPASDAAQKWDGWQTALKPSVEMYWLLRKPLSEKSVAANVLRWGTGAINVDACKVGSNPVSELKPEGRWPANTILSHSPECKPSGVHQVTNGVAVRRRSGGKTFGGAVDKPPMENMSYGTEKVETWDCAEGCAVKALEEQNAGASRFFYVAKPSKKEKNLGLDHLPEYSPGTLTGRKDGSAGLSSPRAGAGRTSSSRNSHPTTKSVTLMRYLCRMITPPEGTALDPFMGSGTTGVAAIAEGFRFVGIENEAEYFTLAEARIKYEWNKIHENQTCATTQSKLPSRSQRSAGVVSSSASASADRLPKQSSKASGKRLMVKRRKENPHSPAGNA